MERLKGIIMIITGGVFWGATGPLMEWTLAESAISVPFLLTIRLTLGGAFLLLYLLLKKKDITSIWKRPTWRNQLIIFSIFGMLGVQYSFTATIAASNAVVATLLQFSAPIFIIIYVSLIHRQLPPRYQISGIAGTLVGLFLLMTNGQIDSLLVSNEAFMWGGIVGIAFAFYTLYPSRLMKDISVLTVVGWAMLLAGVILGIVSQVWKSDEWSILVQGLFPVTIALLIIFGTLAFVLFLSSMKYISAVEASILSVFEPLTAMAISAIWFGTLLKSVQFVGVGLMLVCIILLSLSGGKRATLK